MYLYNTNAYFFNFLLKSNFGTIIYTHVRMMKDTLYTLYSVNLLHLLQDVEKGELHSNVAGLSPSICSRPTSSSRTSTSAESRVELEDKLRNSRNRTNVSNIAVEVEIGTSNNEPIGTLNVTVRTELESYVDISNRTLYVYTYMRMLYTGAGTDVITTTTTPKTRTRTVRGTERSAANRWKAVGRLLRRLALIMFVISSLVACLALLSIYAGPIFLVQLLVVILVAYLVAGGRFRWFYIALKTAPRDFM